MFSNLPFSLSAYARYTFNTYLALKRVLFFGKHNAGSPEEIKNSYHIRKAIFVYKTNNPAKQKEFMCKFEGVTHARSVLKKKRIKY